MTKTELMNGVTRTFHRVGFKIKKHSPEILLVAGVAGTVVSAVMACKATTKIDFILEDTKNRVDRIHECAEKGEIKVEKDGAVEVVEYTPEDQKKDLTIVYTQTGLKFVKLYGPSVALGILSITSILASNNIMRKRNIALAAAYTTVDRGFKEYRGRVVERFGKELDRELKYNIVSKEVEETVVDENGEEKTITKTISTGTIGHSAYTVVFDEHCTGWEKNAEYNKLFLLQQQNYANEKLQSDGYLLLNDVYQMLGVNRTEMGSTVGWVYDPKDPNLANVVDFGIFDLYDETKRDFVNGRERSIWLDLNPDGNVWELMK